jgi:hypothetical protein
MDGFRLDATHALIDNSTPHFLQELTEKSNSNSLQTHVVIYAEDDRNSSLLIEDLPIGKRVKHTLPTRMKAMDSVVVGQMIFIIKYELCLQETMNRTLPTLQEV